METLQTLGRESGNDQQDGISPGGPGLENLVPIDDEILP